jgi:hypothetical protein
MNWLSANQIRETPPVELGTGGFCFLVAEILLERFPSAIVYRLTSPGSPFAHIFISINGCYMDIEGCRNVPREMRRHLDAPHLQVEMTDLQTVREFFYQKYDESQHCAARATLEHYVNSNPERFASPNFQGS